MNGPGGASKKTVRGRTTAEAAERRRSFADLPPRMQAPYIQASRRYFAHPHPIDVMADSDRQDLTGLARSIDRLFSQPGERAGRAPESPRPATPLDEPWDAAPEGDAREPAAFDVENEPAASWNEEPVADPTWDLAAEPDPEEPADSVPDVDLAQLGPALTLVGEGMDDVPDPVGEEAEDLLAGSAPAGLAEEDAGTDGAADPLAAGFDLEMVPEFTTDSEAAPEFDDPPALDAAFDADGVPDFDAAADLDVGPDLGSDSASAALDDPDAPPAFEQTTLDTAVDALVGGDPSQASEVESLAAAFLEGKELEPIARAVQKLALAAGDPPDPSMLSVAHSIASPPVLARLASRIGGERDEGRRRTWYAMCRALGTPMARAIRDDLAATTDRHARRVLCDALVDMGPAGREVIEEMAVDDNRFLVRNAVTILGDTGGERAVELVTSALANPDARVRKEALRALAKLGDEESGQLVTGLLDDPDEDVCLAAAVAAGELRVERALKSLITMVETSKDPDRTVPLLRALGQLGDPGAVASIEKYAVRTLFSKPRADVRIAAYRALHQIGTPHARRLLNQAVDDKEAEVKAAVKEMLHMR